MSSRATSSSPEGNTSPPRARTRAEAERENERYRLLLAATSLVGTLDLPTTLDNVSKLLVPLYADLLTVDLVLESGTSQRVTAYAADPAKVDVAKRLAQFTSSGLRGSMTTPPLEQGKGVLVRDVTEERLRASCESEEHFAAAKELAPRALLSVPLRSRGQLLGVLTLVDTTGERGYDEADLVFSEEMGRLVAVVIDNARLLEVAQRERARAEEANEAKDEFLAAVSHELRTPLNAILGWVQILRGDTLPPERQGRALETVERNARAQSQLIEDLLDVTRIVTGKLHLDVADVDLGDVAAMAAEALKPAADAKGVVLLVDVGDGGPVALRGDPDRLRQVVWNLLSNAVKFTPSGGRVTMVVTAGSEEQELIVRDTGIGIAPEFVPHVFERFRQSSSGSRRKQGLGLGMAIAKHIVDLHGGTITARSEGLGRGAEFTIRLPSAQRRRTPVTAIAAAIVAHLPDLSGARVLVVDDEPDMLEPLVAILEQVGTEVTTATNAADALAQLTATLPDAIVADLAMPHEDGLSLIRKVRALPSDAGGRTPAIALTGLARLQDRTRALVAGFNLHVAKPIEPTEIVVALASLLGRLEGSPPSTAFDATSGAGELATKPKPVA